jgi:hypothetical protein
MENIKLIDIAEKWLKLLLPSPEITGKVINRAETCEPCEKKVYNNEKRLNICTACGCSVTGKIFTFDQNVKCPLNKWAENQNQ